MRIPLHIASDPLSRLTTPLLHLLSSQLRVPEVLSLARANRILFCAMLAHDTPWRKRWAKAAAAGPAGANKQAPAAAASSVGSGARGAAVPFPRGGGGRGAAASSRAAPASKAAAAASSSTPLPTAATAAGRASLPSLVPTALAHFQNQSAAARSLYPVSSTLPPSSPYRWALQDHLRTDSSARFSTWASTRCRNVQHTFVHKPIIEMLGLKIQLKVQMHKRPLQLPSVTCTLFDNSLVAAWPVRTPGLLLRDLRSVSLLAHSSKLMQSMQLGGASEVASSHNRSWSCVRQASAQHGMSLLEWQTSDPAEIAAAQAAAAASSDSPFEPNAAAQARASARSARSAHRTASDAHSLPIPGMGLKVLAGVWGAWASASSSSSASGPSSTAAYNGTELAFLWCSVPYSLILAHLPPEALPSPSPLRQPRWLVARDDLDSLLGQHSLRVNLSFRNLTRTMWSFFLSGLNGEIRREIPRPSGAPGKGGMVLRLPDLSTLAPQWSQLPNLPWKAQLWSGRFERLCILDLVVGVEDRVLWVVSAPMDLRVLESSKASGERYASMDEPNVIHSQGAHHQPGVGACAVEITHAPAVHASADGRRIEQADASSDSSSSVEGTTRLQSLRLALDLDFIDARFGTLYARTGSASMSHALQSRAYAEMAPAEYAEFQRQQMRLRSEEEMERPLGRGAGAGAGAAAPFVPQFAVHAPAPAPAGGGRGAVPGPNAAAAAARRSRGAAASAASHRPQWQDIVDKPDDDAGFKF